MGPTNYDVPSKRTRRRGHIGRREKTQIPPETMLEVLLWLDRFDLDAKQISAKPLRSLIENNRLPLRSVDGVDYVGVVPGSIDMKDMNVRLSITVTSTMKTPRHKARLLIETDTDVQKAASYLSSCFVFVFTLKWHTMALPKNEIIAAPPLIHQLAIDYCRFDKDQDVDGLSETINGSTFRRLVIFGRIPAWQVNDALLESLRLHGCYEIFLGGDTHGYDEDEKFSLTEKGILSYCFPPNDGLPSPEYRFLRTPGATVTPAFFKEVVEASKNLEHTSDVELCLDGLTIDVGNLDVGVLPSRSQEYDHAYRRALSNVRYNIPEHGSGVRLLMHFKSKNGAKWNVIVRHGKKDHEEFFEPTPYDEESNDEDDEDEEEDGSSENNSELEDPDWDGSD